MCYEEIACPSCSSPNIKKNGRTANRKQRFKCKGCFRQLLTDYTNLGCLPEIRWLVIVLTLNGCDIRDIERVLLISHTTILKTLLAEAAAVDEPSVPGRIEMLELDEFWSLVGFKRRPRWTWYAWHRQRHQVVAIVQGRRNDQSGQALRRTLAGQRSTLTRLINGRPSATASQATVTARAKEGRATSSAITSTSEHVSSGCSVARFASQSRQRCMTM